MTERRCPELFRRTSFKQKCAINSHHQLLRIQHRSGMNRSRGLVRDRNSYSNYRGRNGGKKRRIECPCRMLSALDVRLFTRGKVAHCSSALHQKAIGNKLRGRAADHNSVFSQTRDICPC